MNFATKDIKAQRNNNTNTNTASTNYSYNYSSGFTTPEYLKLVVNDITNIEDGIITKSTNNNLLYGDVVGNTAIYFYKKNASGWIFKDSLNNNVASISNTGAFSSSKFNVVDNNNNLIAISGVDGYLNVSGNILNQIPTIQGKINGLNEQLLLNPDGGNIIIGQTTNTGQKLQVNGNIKSSGLLLSNEKGDYLIEGDYNGLKVNGNAIGAKIYKYSELNTYTFTDEDVSNSFNAYTIKKIINDKYNATGGTINGDVNITGNLTVNGSSITNITNTQVINALGYTPYNATNPNNYITANHSGSITATGFIKNGGTSSQFLKADGSVDNNSYVTPTYSGNITATAFIKNGGTSSQFLKANGSVDNTSYVPFSSVGGLDVNTAIKLRLDNTIVNGASGLQFAQYSDGDNPGGGWYSHLIMNHGNPTGYYVDLMVNFDQDVMFMRRKVGGVVQPEKRFVMQNDNVNFSKITVNNVGKIYFDGYGGELSIATHSYGAYLDVNNSSNALYIRNANNSYSNIATFSSSVNTIGNTTLFGNGSNTKVSISDGGYIGIDSINTNDNLTIRAKGAGGVLMNYGVSGAYTGFYDGTTLNAFINSAGTGSFNGDLVVKGNITFSKKYKSYPFTKGSAGWVRIAKLITSTGEAYGTISLTNSYYNNEPSSLTFSFGTNYRTNSGWVTQIGANTLLISKIRIVAPTENNTDYYIELYYNSTSVNNNFQISLSNDCNVELYSSFTEGSIPSTYVSREYYVNQFGISTHSVLVGNVGFNTNRIEVNDNGFLSITTNTNELLIGKTHVGDALYINYRQPKTGSAPTTYIWNNGTSTGYADHQVGSLTANEIRFKSNYTTNYISGDGYGISFNGSQYVYFTQSQPTYFSSQIVARGGINNDSASNITLHRDIKVDGLVEFKSYLKSIDQGNLSSNTAFQIRGVGESGVYSSGIAFDTFNIESGESAYTYKERMRIFSNGNVAIGSTINYGYKLNVNGSTRLAGTLNVTGAITVSSTAKVTNLQADKVDGFDFWSGSKSAYDAITTKSTTTIYIIT